MKNVNFINPLPPKQQQEIKRWARRSLLIGIGTIIIISGIHLHQTLALRELKKEYALIGHYKKNFDEIMARNNTLKQEELQLNSKLAQIKAWQEPMAACTYLNTIAAMHHTAQLKLESLSVAGNRFEISAQCPHETAILSCITDLAKIDRVENVQLAALRPAHGATGAYVFQAHGAVNKKTL